MAANYSIFEIAIAVKGFWLFDAELYLRGFGSLFSFSTNHSLRDLFIELVLWKRGIFVVI